VTSAPVGREKLADRRTVKISLVRSTAPPLALGSGGRVTATFCRPGRPLRSGRTIARIDDAPVVALSTSMPLHRDLSRGSRGRDVRALQRELSRLGYPVRADGRYRRSTAAAVRKLRTEAGDDRPDGTIAYRKILWLAAPSVVPDSCELVRGAFVASGATVAKVPPRLISIVVASIPADVVPGARVIDAMGITGRLGRDGTATDPAYLRRVSATQEYRLAQATGEDADLSAHIALRKPVDTVKVPPGALFTVRGDRGCLQSGARTYAARIVGSRLGATLVAVTGPVPEHVDLGSSITSTSCG
jgi:peptidoglycan hydrolase-like protein with peptidoglycan-binding domain